MSARTSPGARLLWKDAGTYYFVPRAAAVWWYSARQLRLQVRSDSRSVLAVHTACDCSCKGSESGKAEAVTAEVGGFEFAQRRGGPN